MTVPAVRAAEAVEDVAEAWSVLADELCSLPNWLRTAEARAERGQRYAVLEGEDPAAGPRGGLVAYGMDERSWFFNNPVEQLCAPSETLGAHLTDAERRTLEEYAPKLAAERRSLYPALVSVLPSGYLPGVLRAPSADAARDAATAAELAAVLEGLAEEREESTVAVMHVPEVDTVLREALTARGHLPFVTAGECVLHVDWDDFEGYLASLPSPRPNRIRREVRAFTESGAVLREATLEDLDERHAQLHAGHLRRYGHDVAIEGSRALIRGIRAHPTGRGRVLEALRDGELVGFLVCYELDRVLHPKMIGVAEGEKRSFTYFNLTYYGVVRLAAAEGARRIVYGPAAYEAKALRGCALERRISHVLPPADLRELVAPVAAALDGAHRRLLDSHAWAPSAPRPG